MLRQACGLLLLALTLGPQQARADELSSAVFMRLDTDHTTVVSPRAHANKHIFDETEVDVAYSADIWSSASVDVRASASVPVHEQRDELSFNLAQAWDELRLSGGYRYSVENDYVSHGANLVSSYDFADHNTELALTGYALFDTVGRAGLESFAEPLNTSGGRASLTQVFDPMMLGQLVYELTFVNGYQASPYRRVGLGGSGLGCAEALRCVDEHEPSARMRNAAALIMRRALSETISGEATYRFVVDDWGLMSHTAMLELSWLASEHAQLNLRYRFYLQSGVNFYQSIYPADLAADAYVTRDREQSPMSDHHLGLDWEQRVHVDDGLDLSLVAAIGASLFDYQEFVGLSKVYALEATVAIGLVR